MKENRDATDTNVATIEKDIINAQHFIDSIKTDKEYKEENGWHGYYNKEIVELARILQHILSDYKRVLKENEMYKRNSEIMSKENLSTAEQLKVEIKENFRLKNQLENNRKEYQETYKDIKEELKELKKENEELKNEVMEKDLKIIGTEEYTKASMKEIIAQYYTANEDCIPKSKIKDIINRMDYDIKKTKEIISNNSNIYTSDRRNDYQIVRLRAMNTKSLDIKNRLQELLESEE